LPDLAAVAQAVRDNLLESADLADQQRQIVLILTRDFDGPESVFRFQVIITASRIYAALEKFD
jgi:hypothetical protein